MPLTVVRVPITHPDATALIDEVQAEYAVRYGSPDASPVEPADFEPPRGAFHVGYADGAAVATGAWRSRPVPPGVAAARVVEIKRMYVVPHARGRGLARAMLAHLESTARAAGAEAVVLETGTAQPEAIALYESSGYTRIPGFGYYCGSDLSRCFGKPLPPDVA